MDRRQGGFFENYEPPKFMRPKQGGAKTIVFQIRQTWVAATAMRRRPDEAKRAETIARHGLEFLTEHMVDREHGGVFWGVDAKTKQPRWDGKKHAYGISFAIYAGAAVEKALPGEGGKEFAIETFRWLDEHAYDEEHGGYFEHLARDGTPIRNDRQREAGGKVLPYNTSYDIKTHNTNLHLLEGFTELYGVWPDEQLKARIEELLGLFLNEMYAEVEGPGGETVGTFWETFDEDWSVVDKEHISYGHNVEGAFLILEAAEVIGVLEGEDGEEILRKAKLIVDGSLAAGWDEEAGGLWNKGTITQANARRKDWWVQAESLNALAIMDHYFGNET
ncbi:MAG: AGE family epimerase/isomerase, partial [Planctomycetota bacterium]